MTFPQMRVMVRHIKTDQSPHRRQVSQSVLTGHRWERGLEVVETPTEGLKQRDVTAGSGVHCM